MKQKWYFTFGVGDSIHSKHFVCIEDTNENARNKMFEHFGNKWAFDYPEDKWIYDRMTNDWKQAVQMGIIPERIDLDHSIQKISQAELFGLTEFKLED